MGDNLPQTTSINVDNKTVILDTEDLVKVEDLSLHVFNNSYTPTVYYKNKHTNKYVPLKQLLVPTKKQAILHRDGNTLNLSKENLMPTSNRRVSKSKKQQGRNTLPNLARINRFILYNNIDKHYAASVLYHRTGADIGFYPSLRGAKVAILKETGRLFGFTSKIYRITKEELYPELTKEPTE